MGQDKLKLIRLKGALRDDVVYARPENGRYYVRFRGSSKEYTYAAKDVEFVRETPQNEDDDAWGRLQNYLVEFCKHVQIVEPGSNGKENVAWSIVERSLGLIDSTRAKHSALAPILTKTLPPPNPVVKTPIFPFGCNESQMKAVEKALSSTISVIQGPPGTGKTQTILNILANLLCADKKVAVVSNNNMATRNVCEKLGKPEWNLRWIVAELGNNENKKAFFENPPARPELEPRALKEGLAEEVARDSKILAEHYRQKSELQEFIAKIREQRFQYESFLSDSEHAGIDIRKDPVFLKMRTKSSGKLNRIERRARRFVEGGGFFTKLLLLFTGVPDVDRLKSDPDRMLDAITAARIETTLAEWDERKTKLSDFVKQTEGTEKKFTEASKKLFLTAIFERFAGSKLKDDAWTKEDFRRSPSFFKRYPVVSSTSFALPFCAPKGEYFDYVVMDEASQINLPTALVCFACAKRVVIVGDTKQLPAIFPPDAPSPTTLWDNNALDASNKSILDAVLSLFGDKVPETLLREHYRCHPDIIGFCNRMFYDGKLIPMTTADEDVVPFEWIRDDSPPDTLERRTELAEATKEPSKRARTMGITNERQANIVVDVIRDLIGQGYEAEEIGIVIPYALQKALLMRSLKQNGFDGIKVDTVHGFQGGEKDVIVFGVVNNHSTQFLEDPNLLNVAVSRAKDRFVLISPEFSETDGVIGSLVRYIDLLSPEKRLIRESPFRSIFDMLFDSSKSDGIARKEGESPSEALFRQLAGDVLGSTDELHLWGFTQEYPLRMLPQRLDNFTDEERRFMRNGSRLDFLFFHKVTKEPLAVVEVDGYSFHREGTRQAERDALKDSVLRKVGIPLLRLSTRTETGREGEKLKSFLLSVHSIRKGRRCPVREPKS